jgi:uncharacterized protein (DUF952 family)
LSAQVLRERAISHTDPAGTAGTDRVTNVVYKIVDELEWRRAQTAGSYQGSADDRRDGFIHLSFADQVEATAARHFRNRQGLLIVAFQQDALGDALRLETSRGGALFPHLYSALPVEKALWARAMPPGPDGVPRAAGDLA